MNFHCHHLCMGGGSSELELHMHGLYQTRRAANELERRDCQQQQDPQKDCCEGREHKPSQSEDPDEPHHTTSYRCQPSASSIPFMNASSSCCEAKVYVFLSCFSCPQSMVTTCSPWTSDSAQLLPFAMQRAPGPPVSAYTLPGSGLSCTRSEGDQPSGGAFFALRSLISVRSLVFMLLSCKLLQLQAASLT